MNKTSPRTQSPSIIYFKMEDICEELDHLTVECFDSLECLQEKREYLNASIRGGHLHLSKARHSMGNKSVGALQYSHKMDRALYHVVVYLETFHRAVRKRCCNVWNGENTVKKRKGFFESWLFWKRRGGKHSQGGNLKIQVLRTMYEASSCVSRNNSSIRDASFPL